MKIIKIFAHLILLFLSPGLFSQVNKAVPIILDTDIGPDYDDVGAMAVLHAFQHEGEANILGIIASNKYGNIATVINVINTFYKKPNIPIGVLRGEGVNEGPSQKWDSLIINKYPHQIKSNKEVEEAVMLYRKLLSKQPDKSVTIVTIGFLTNISNLLNSQPDQYSKLNGKELILNKVKMLVSMAGKFPSGKEFNVKKMRRLLKYVFNNWPGKIIFSGFEIGSKIFTGFRLSIMEK